MEKFRISEINNFPILETKYFSTMFIFSDRRNSITVESIRKNSKSKKIYFIKLKESDLKCLEQSIYENRISKELMEHNEFAVNAFQVTKIK